MPALRLVSHAMTHVGLLRRRNEDAVLDRPDLGLWAVADGMGGHEAGDYASARIVEALGTVGSPADLDDAVRDVAVRLNAVDVELRDRAARLGRFVVIASTVVVLAARADQCAVLWAGDSRLYRWRAGELRQLTTDHSQAQELVDAGLLRAAEAVSHPSAHVVTRAIGAGPVEFAVLRDTVLPGDRFLLCSDGLTNMLADADIAGEIAAAAAPGICARLIEAALARGGIDNVTVVIITAEPAG